MEIIILLNEFERCAISQHDYTKSGDWQLGNAEIRKINDVYKKIRKEGKIAQEQLLNLVDSNVPAVAVLAATYSMKFDPIRCLEVLKRLSLQFIPHISSGAKYAIMNWENNEWYIE